MKAKTKCVTVELRMDLRMYRILLVLFFCAYWKEIKYSFRYFIARIIFHSIVLFSGVIYIPVILFSSRREENRRCYARYMARETSRLFGVTWTIRGKLHLPERSGALLVANHQHDLDIIGLFLVRIITSRCVCMAEKELRWRSFGFVAGLAGAVFTDQGNTTKISEILMEKKKLFLFPEGTKNKDVRNSKKLLPFKNGAFRSAIEAQVPVVPVVFSPYYFIDDEKRTLFPGGKVIISVLPPVPTCGLHLRDTGSLTNSVRDQMQNEYDNLDDEAYRCNDI